MITIVIWTDGYANVRHYKCPEHGWVFPSLAAASSAAKQCIKNGALTATVLEISRKLPILQTDTGKVLAHFERGSNGKAIERRG